jgi:hypothetical protein
MAKNFLDQEDQPERLSYTDGFRFGFGFFIANLLGLTALSALGLLVGHVTHQLR